MGTVVYVGNLGPDAAPYSTENDIRRAFETLGWEVIGIPERQFITESESGRLDADFYCQGDLLLETLTQGQYPDPDAVLALWDEARRRGVPTASIHLDVFYGLASPKNIGPQRYLLPRTHPMFRVSVTFTADGDSDEAYARDGVNHHWLPPAVCHEETYDAEPDPKWAGIDVAFVGARGYHPEHPRDKLVDHLAISYGPRFARVAGDTQYGTVRGHALNRLYASIPVIAGDSCFAGGAKKYLSDRFFETWGRGGFLVFPRIPWLVETFGNYPSWAPYDDFDAMTAEIDYWLDHPEVREEERLRMARLVRSEHTYLQRVQTMLDTIGLT